LFFVGSHNYVCYILARCEDIHAHRYISIVGSAVWDVNLTMIAQSLPLPVPHVTVSNTSFHKASKWYGPLQVKAIDGLHEDGPQIALYVLAELAVSRTIRVVQYEWSIPAAELDLCRIMAQLIDGPRLISHRLNPHIWLLTDGHETLV
jgi:hypothetical protein